MSLSESIARFIRRSLSFGKKSDSTKSIRSVAPMLIAVVALLAAVVFSVSVESRRSGSSRKAEPSTAPGSPEVAKNSTAPSVNPNRSLGTSPRLAPFVPTVTASKTDALFVDNDLDLLADPGDTLKYTVVIGATGEDATGVTFTDTVDTNTAFVAGSLRTTPLARNDSYSAAGNIRITQAAPGVLANDQDFDAVGGPISVTAGTFLSAQGGNVTLNADGSFTYNPAPGFEGADSFTYTLNDNDTPNNTDTGTVSITVTGMIWFINNNASCPCDGRLTNPFNTLAAFEAVNGVAGVSNPAANDNIFVYESATNYIGPLNLENGQKFIGQDATASLSSISGVTPPAGSDPLPPTSPGAPIVNITGNGIIVAQNNILRGFTGGNATTDISGTGFVTLNISDVTLNGTGRALDLANGTLTAVFGSISSTDSVTQGINLTTIAGSLTTGSTTITNPTLIGISVNTSSGTFNFANTAVTLSGNTGVSLTTNTGPITFGDLDIAPDAGQKGLLATENSGIITTTSGTLNAPNSSAVEITRASSTTPLNVSLTSVSADGGGLSGIILTRTSGSFTVTGDGGVANNGSGGSISNKVGAGNLAGVRLNIAENVRLNYMNLNSNDGSGVFGTTVNGFQLHRCNINNNGDQVAPDESGVELVGLIGTGIAGSNPTSITNTTISNNFEFQGQITNTTGTLTDLQMSGNTISGNGAGAIGNLFNFLGLGTATMKLSLTSGSFTGNAPATATGVNCDHSGTSGTLTCNVSGATFTNNNVGVTASQAQGGNLKFTISGNTATGNRSHGLNLFIAAIGTGTVDGSFLNNTVGTVGVDDSGSLLGFGIRIQNEGSTAGAPNANVLVSGNTVREISSFPGINVNQGIAAQANTRGTNVTITNNTVSGVDDSRAILVSQNNTTAPGFTCADISGNEMNNIAGQVGDGTKIRIRQLAGGTFNLRQTSLADLAAQNSPPVGVATTTTTLAQISSSGTITFNAGQCTQPSALVFETSELAKATPVNDRKSTHTTTLSATDTGSPSVAVQGPESAEQSNALLANPSRPSMELNKSKRESGTTLRWSDRAQSLNNQVLTAGQKKRTRSAVGVKAEAVVLAGETVTHSVGTLRAGKTVRIQFQVTVNVPYLGGAFVSNQGTVSGSNFSNVLTDDPDVGGGADPTLTPIVLTPNISVADAQANEPTSGTTQMLFVVTLSSPAVATTTVHYETADQPPAPNHAVAGSDYTAVPDTVLTFAVGEQFKTVPVTILSDSDAGESTETFLLNLSNATNAVITDGQAIGTINQGNAAGTVLISELRTSGPGGAGDDFVEIYNNSDSPHTVAASDASGGYGLYKMGADCSATPVLLGVIPNGTVLPARGHYLFTGSAYSLANYGGTGAAAGNLTLSSDIENDRNVALFTTGTVTNISSANRLDAVGFGTNTGGICDLFREGTTLPALSGSTLEYSYFRDECGKKGNPAQFGPCPTGGLTKDSNINADDFIFADTQASNTIAGQRLGAPGPQNLASPIVRNSTITVLLLDSTAAAPAPPNRVRDFTPVTNGTNGTLSIRRRFVNNTGAQVTRLRFRIVDFSSIAVPGGIADLRALTSSDIPVVVGDASTCTASGAGSTPCTVTVRGTTVEEPPTQAMGGALNSTMTTGTITLGTPLAPGASINLQFRLGVQQTGSFKFFFNVEALP